MLNRTVSFGIRLVELRRRSAHLRTAIENGNSTYREIAELYKVWPNKQWAASAESLRRITDVLPEDGFILECGSGLSTLVFAAYAAATKNVTFTSLEHHRGWWRRMQLILASAGYDPRLVRYAPLQTFDTYDWYAIPSEVLRRIGSSGQQCIFIDGPPGTTRGGRFGALPTLADVLKGGAIVLLDDAQRTQEQDIIRRWEDQYGLRRCGQFGSSDHSVAALRVPERFEAHKVHNSATDPEVQGADGGLPLVTVIIPTRNRIDLTISAVASVSEQTYKNAEIVVVDDASDGDARDRLEAALEPYDARSIFHEHRQGAQATRESGLQAARGEFIALLDSDDLWHHRKLERQVALLLGNPWLDVALTLHRWQSSAGEIRRVASTTEVRLSSALPTTNMSTPLFRRDSLMEVGGFQPATQEHYPTGEGVAFYLRIAQRMTFGLCPEVLVYCRDHSGSRNSDQMGTVAGLVATQRIINEHGPVLDADPHARADLLRVLASRHFKQQQYAAGHRALARSAYAYCVAQSIRSLLPVLKVLAFGLKAQFTSLSPHKRRRRAAVAP